MSPTIAIFGGSFNPPGAHHRVIAEQLASQFDELLIIPCGPRPDKPVTNDVDPVYRAAMVDMTFRGIPGVRVELFDLESRTFTRQVALEEQHRTRGEVYHVIGSDLLQGGREGKSPIQREWFQGQKVWNEFRFAVLERPGYPLDPADLPPRQRVFDLSIPGASCEIRDRVFHRQEVGERVTPEVRRFIDRYGLYCGMRPNHKGRLALAELKPLVIADPQNPRAQELACKIPSFAEGQANLVLVVGGDGTMLHAIRSQWRHRLPFYGINAGHLGFLLNDEMAEGAAVGDLLVEHLPLLWVEMDLASGERRSALAFNDAWLERASGQTAWLRVAVDGCERLSKLVADGALVGTAAGSTAYARAMGAHPLPLNVPSLMLVGSNVLHPAFFKPAVLPIGSTVELTSLEPHKRPLRGFIDGILQGEVTGLRARVSHAASVELVFDPRQDLGEKLARIQFPLGTEG